MSLIDYGWDGHFEESFKALNSDSLIPARITADFGMVVKAVTEQQELNIERRINEGIDYCVGDFVCIDYDSETKRYSVKELLERKTKFSRVAAGPALKEQVVASNMDTVFIMQSLNNDFNLRRLERYIIAVWESGAAPVVVLSKSDLCEDTDAMTSEVFSVAAGVEIHAVSAVTGENMLELGRYFSKGKTVAVLGSSGVGKSTLINSLAGEEILKTQEVLRDDDRGRHTTTHRQLVLLPGGGVVMDTPGMRTLGLWESESGMENMFSDIMELSEMCRFRDCSHKSEPGCAIKQALEEGTLDAARWASYMKLQKELEHIRCRKNQKARMKERQFAKMVKNHNKEIW